MIVIPVVLFGPVQLALTSGTIYTTIVNGKVVVTRVVLTNVSVAPRLIDIWIGRASAAVADSNLLVSQKSLSVDESWVCNELAGAVLGSLDKIYMGADAAASVNALGSGYGVAS